MDIAAHNATVDWLTTTGTRAKYKHFIFLNSSVRGPFVPNYLPRGWQWTQAFTARLTDTVKVRDMSFCSICIQSHCTDGSV